RRATGEQFEEQYTERIDVGARVDVGARRFGLFGTHVFRRTDKLVLLGVQRVIRQATCDRFRYSKVNDLGRSPAIDHRHQYVAGLDVAVNDSFLVCMLHGAADVAEQRQSVADGQSFAIAIRGNILAAYQFHHEVGPAALRRAGVQDAGDV